MDQDFLPGSGSGIIVPDPDTAKYENYITKIFISQ